MDVTEKKRQELKEHANTLWAYRRASFVKRHHTQLTLRGQNLAEHCYGVACLVDFLTGYTTRAQLFRAAMYHDVSEYITGDIPQPFKVACPEVHKALNDFEETYERKQKLNQANLDISPEERKVLKVADLLEYLFFCFEEVSMGNSLYSSSPNRVIGIIEKEYVLLEDDETKLRVRFVLQMLISALTHGASYYD